MKPFSPHPTQTRIEMTGGEARIFIPRAIHDKIYHIVDLSKAEVSWLGQVEQVKDLHFILGESHIFEQVVNFSETEITTDDLARFGQQLLTEHDNGEEIWNSIRLWGHFHPHGSTNPSKQDDDQMKIFMECGHPYFLRLIVTKTGKMEFTLYLIEKGITIFDVPWEFLEPVDNSAREEIAQQLKAKVRVKKYKPLRGRKGKGYRVVGPGSMAHLAQMAVGDDEFFPSEHEDEESEFDDLNLINGPQLSSHLGNVITTITRPIIQRQVVSRVKKSNRSNGGNGNGR